jgi:ribosome maturation factor RimP
MELKDKIKEWLQPMLDEQNLYLTDIKIAGRGKVEVYADGDEGVNDQPVRRDIAVSGEAPRWQRAGIR